MATTDTDYTIAVKGDTVLVTLEANAKTTLSKIDVEARKALPGASLIFRGEAVKRGKARKTVRVYRAK